jgi:hypothetical protein
MIVFILPQNRVHVPINCLQFTVIMEETGTKARYAPPALAAQAETVLMAAHNPGFCYLLCYLLLLSVFIICS